jgi:hypothetical protein
MGLRDQQSGDDAVTWTPGFNHAFLFRILGFEGEALPAPLLGAGAAGRVAIALGLGMLAAFAARRASRAT